MSYLVLSRKWRPDKFEKLVGQGHISKTLLNAIELDKVAHAYLFTGSRGVGKTTAARILAKELNNTNIDKIATGQNLDITELDGASNRGIDEIRDIKESVKYPPSNGRYRIFIIDEVHMLTEPAFNALLKTLEEPPKYVVFIMATTEPQKIPQTIISRSQRFDFRRLSMDDITGHLEDIMKKEKIEFEEQILEMIALKSDGSMRDALSYLDQLIVYSNDIIRYKDATYILGVIDYNQFISIMGLLTEGRISDVIKSVNEVINSGISINNFVNGFINFIRDVLLSDVYPSKPSFRDGMISISDRYSDDDLLYIINMFQDLQGKLKSIDQPRISLELLLLRVNSHINGSVDISNKRASNIQQGPPENQITNNKSDDKENTPVEKIVNNTSNNTSKIDTGQKSSSLVSSEIVSDNIDKESKGTDSIKDNWSNVISSIGKIKPNIASILEDSTIVSEGEDIVIKLESSYEFDFNQVEKNKSMIEDHLFDKSSGNDKKNVILVKNTSKKVEEEAPSKEHPLLSSALESFNGEIER